ncbi:MULTISPECIES: hypothetical protein [Myxococcus]|uniref:hypothetical protein n=1 Tax=Myxococcus TaxID=32 RepID=UPI001129CE2E|nr:MULTISPECIES: hypothetical protein [Myxococcus]WAM29917.1 hypothetical protein OZ403_18010 [Myxococcus sp. NMCA1]
MSELRERLRLRGILSDEYPVPGLHYLPGPSMKALRLVLDATASLLAGRQLFPSQFPFVIPTEVAKPFFRHFRDAVVPTVVSDGRSHHKHGILPLAGGCLQAIPFLTKQTRSYRQLPGGVYSTDFACAPFTQAHGACGWEDVHCINGLDLRHFDAAPRGQELIEQFLNYFGLAAVRTEEPWWFETNATVFRTHGGALLAVAQPDVLECVAGIRYLDAKNQFRQGKAEFFYISEDALLLATGELK